MTTPDARSRRPALLDAFGRPHYWRLWVLGFFTNTARWMDVVVLGWVVLELTGSPAMVGVAAFCRSVPMLALGLVAGLLADRFHRGRLLCGVQVLNLASALALAVLFGLGSGGLLLLLLLEVALGVAWAVDFTVRRTLMAGLVGPGGLTNAMSLETASMDGAKILGPVVGGLLLARAGPAGAYTALALCYGAALAAGVSLHRRVALPGTAGPRDPVVGSLVAGWHEVRVRPVIRMVLATTVLMNALVFPYQHLLPVLARERLAVGPDLLGVLVAASGLGALVGALALGARRGLGGHELVFVGGSLAAALLVVGLALSPWYALSVALQLVIGAAESGFGTMQSAIVLLSVPERARGRAMGILAVCIGTQPFGALWAGFLAGHAGAALASASGAALAVLLLLPIASRVVRTGGRAPRGPT